MGGDLMVLENRRRRERVVVTETPEQTAGARMSMRVTQEPTDARPPAHRHPRQRETFTIQAGRLTYVTGRDAPRTAAAGDSVVIEPGLSHTWWNDGPETVEMIGVIEPAGRWLAFMQTIYGLTRDGKVNARGIPSLLQIGVIAWHFRREWVPTAVPAPVRLIVFPLVAGIGTLLGYRPTYARYSDPGAWVEEHEPASATV